MINNCIDENKFPPQSINCRPQALYRYSRESRMTGSGELKFNLRNEAPNPGCSCCCTTKTGVCTKPAGDRGLPWAEKFSGTYPPRELGNLQCKLSSSRAYSLCIVLNLGIADISFGNVLPPVCPPLLPFYRGILSHEGYSALASRLRLGPLTPFSSSLL